MSYNVVRALARADKCSKLIETTRICIARFDKDVRVRARVCMLVNVSQVDDLCVRACAHIAKTMLN